MASYHLAVHDRVSRGKGQSLAATAAYNGRTKLVDERTGETWDYTHLGGHLFGGNYVPKGSPEWAHDLQQLVNAVERAEKRSDSQLAINIDIALPHEQTLEQNRRLAQDFVREEFMRQGYAARMDIHAPNPEADQRNIHVHVWASLRKLGPEGFARTKTEQQERYRNRDEYVEKMRDRWEKLANRHLERNGYDARIDRRSLREQGLDREAEQHRGPAATAMERRGEVTRIGEEIAQRRQRNAEPSKVAALEAEERALQAQIIDLQAERERRYGPVEQTQREVAREQFEGRYDELRATEPSPEVVQSFTAAATQTTEPVAPIYDCDAANREWEDKIATAGIANDEATHIAQDTGRETRAGAGESFAAADLSERQAQKPEREGEAQSPGEAGIATYQPSSENAPAATATRPIVASAPEITAAPASEMRSPGRVADRILGGIGKLAEGVLGFLAGWFDTPKPPPTPDERQREARAADEAARLAEFRAYVAEQEAARDGQIFEQDRQRQQDDLAIRFGTPPPGRSSERTRDDDRGYERER